MYKKKRIKVGLSSLILLCAIAISSPSIFLPLLLAVLIHEAGHIIFARLCGIKLYGFDVDLLGASITPAANLYSYGKEALLCMAGPLFNFITAYFSHRFLSGDAIDKFVILSVGLATLNLLPICGFDGGRIFSCFISKYLSPNASAFVSLLVSFVLVLLLWLLSVYTLLRFGASLGLFVFSVSLFRKLFIDGNAF